MALRKVLLLTYHFPPSAAVAVHRLLGFARHLPRFGWNLIVVAPPSVPGEPQDPDLADRIPPETLVVRVPYPKGWFSRSVGRYAPNLVWLPRAKKAALEVIRLHRPDALFTSSPPHCLHLLGRSLKHRTGLPWVASLRDPWVTNLVPGGVANFWLQRRLEAKVMASADAVVANTPLSCAGLQEGYPQFRDKFVTITNGYDPEVFPSPPPLPVGRQHLNLLYAGELYIGRNPRPLLDALKGLHENPPPGLLPWKVRFLGRATEGTLDLPAEIRSRGLENQVELVTQVPYTEALKQMVAADALLLIHTPGLKVGVPAKLYEYLGTGRPILALGEPDGDIAWVLKQSQVPHRVVPVLERVAIQQALVDLGREIQHNSFASLERSSPLTAFTREELTRKLAECLDTITHSRPSQVTVPQMVGEM